MESAAWTQSCAMTGCEHGRGPGRAGAWRPGVGPGRWGQWEAQARQGWVGAGGWQVGWDLGIETSGEFQECIRCTLKMCWMGG